MAHDEKNQMCDDDNCEQCNERERRFIKSMTDYYFPKRPDDPRDEYPEKGVHY